MDDMACRSLQLRDVQLGKTESLSHDARRLGVASWTHRAARSQCSQILSLATPPRQARSCSFPSSASRSVSWSRVPSSTAPPGRTSFQREAKRLVTYQKVSSQVLSLGGWAMGAAETVALRNLHRCSTRRRAVSHHGHRKKRHKELEVIVDHNKRVSCFETRGSRNVLPFGHLGHVCRH